MKNNFNYCILTQDENNRSCELLKEALENNGNTVTFLQYPNKRATNNKLSWDINTETGIATRGGETLDIKKFDGAIVRSWGTAPIAAIYTKVFEDLGVIIDTEVGISDKSDSKVATTRLFQENNVPMPNSEAYYFEEIEGKDLYELIERFAKGKEKFVVKSDYGTRGEEIKFFSNAEEAKQHIITEKEKGQKGFVLQDFCDTGEKARSYRVVVVGGKVKVGVEITAPEGELIANIAKFSDNDATRLLKDDELSKLSKPALKAAKVLGMECYCGVDLIQGKNTEETTTLEANKSPVISTIVDEIKVPLHQWVANAFDDKVIKGKLKKGEEVVDHQKFSEPLNTVKSTTKQSKRESDKSPKTKQKKQAPTP